jgi:phosphoglycerate dehydrogenase-like enzyme
MPPKKTTTPKKRKDHRGDGRSRPSKITRGTLKAKREKQQQSESNMAGPLATVGILSIGSMGAGVARLLSAYNYRVITNASDRR